MAHCSKKFILTALAFGLGSTTAHAGQEHNSSSNEEIVVEAEKEYPEATEPEIEDPTICRRTDPPTASRIRRTKKICRKKSEWEYLERLRQPNDDEIIRTMSDNLRQDVQAQTSDPLSGF